MTQHRIIYHCFISSFTFNILGKTLYIISAVLCLQIKTDMKCVNVRGYCVMLIT